MVQFGAQLQKKLEGEGSIGLYKMSPTDERIVLWVTYAGEGGPGRWMSVRSLVEAWDKKPVLLPIVNAIDPFGVHTLLREQGIRNPIEILKRLWNCTPEELIEFLREAD